MVEVLKFDVADIERYAGILFMTSTAVSEIGREAAAEIVRPIAGEVWMGKLKSAGKAGLGGGATGARLITDAVRVRTFARDRFRCTYCGGRAIPRSILVALHDLFPSDISYDAHYGRGRMHPIFWALAPEADHVVAHSRGGTNTIENLTTLHAACNTIKSDSLIDDLPMLQVSEVASEWDGLVSLYPSLIAAGAGVARPAYHRKWKRLFAAGA